MISMLTFVDYGETFVFVVLVLASVLALAVGIERAIIFNRNSSKRIHTFVSELVAHLRTRDLAGVRELVSSGGDNSYTRFAHFVLDHYTQAQGGIGELMIGKVIEEKMVLEQRLTVLNTLGNNAPFIGLLGTVLGVIKAFHGLGTLGSTGAEVVMRSISAALLATAAGLFIAIPVVMANNYFTKKIKVIVQNLEILSKEFTASIIVLNDATAGAATASRPRVKTKSKTTRAR